MLFDSVAPDDITSPIRRKFVGSGFQNFLLGLSGTDEYGNTTGWGKAKGVVLPAVYGTLGAVGTTLAGLGPGVGAKFGSQLGSGINSLSGSFGSSLLKGTDGKDPYDQQQAKSAMQAQATAGVLGTLGGLLGGDLLSGKSGGSSAMGAAPVSSLLAGGGSGTGANTNLGLDALEDPLASFKLGLNQNNFGQLAFKGGGEVPTWVKTLRLVGESGTTAYDGKVYDLSNLPMEQSSTKISQPQRVVGQTILSRIASAEGSRYDQKNNVGPGHYGKYQFEPALIKKYAGVSPEEFLKNPDLQELAMQRRLPDLRKEAESALKKTGQSLPLEDAMLLVHFKGLPTAMKEFQNPALMDVATKANPSSKEYLRRASVFMNPLKGSPIEILGSSLLGPSPSPKPASGINADFTNPKKGSPMYSLGETFFATGGQVGKGKIYADSDNTEDYYMVDKRVAEASGLSEAINQISFGQARYGERIFSQKSNEEMKKIMASSKTKAQKSKMLGAHVFSELGLQAKNEPKQKQMFATGDEVNDPKALFEQQKDAYLARLNEAIANLDTFDERQKKPGRPTDVDANRYREFLLRKKEELQLLEYGEVRTQNNTGIGGRTEVNVIGPEDLKTLFDQTEPVITGQFIRNPTLTRQYNQKGADMVSLGGSKFKKYDPAPLKPITWDEFLGKAISGPAKPSTTPAEPTSEIKLPTLPTPATTGSNLGVTRDNGVTGTSAQSTAPQTTGFAFDPSITEEVINAQRRMNQRGSRLLPNFVPIVQDGKWGQSTEILDRQLKARMGSIYNITNQRVVLPTEQGPRLMVTGVDINDPTKQTPRTTFAPMGISGQVGVMSQNQIGQTASTRMAQSIKQTGITKENRPDSSNLGVNRLGEIASYLPDVGRLIVGATTAAANQPKPFDLGSEYFKMKADLENRSNQGLPTVQRNFLTNQLRDNYAAGAETLRSAVGNGASIGTLVAGLGRLGSQYQQGAVGIAGMDEAQRAQNRQTYQNFVLQDLNLRSGLFGREEAIRVANRQGAGMLIGAAMDNIQGRTDFNRQYGPGSQYAQMQGYISDLYKKALESQDKQAQAYMNNLKPS